MVFYSESSYLEVQMRAKSERIANTRDGRDELRAGPKVANRAKELNGMPTRKELGVNEMA